MAYVEKEKVLEIAKDEYYSDFHRSMADLTSLRELLEDTPAADVVEVVRCKDCVHCCISTDSKTNISIQKCGYVGFNPVQSSQVSDDFYCGYGELKEREGK